MTKTWGFAALGLSAFSVLVWLAGPLVTIGSQAPLAPASSREFVIGVFCLQYVLQKLWGLWRARGQNKRIVAALEPSPEADLSPEGVRLRERFTAALALLRGARFATRGGLWSAASWTFGRSYLYQLPWYMIIGAPGAGKTTALLNSGLSFPLAEKLGVGPVAGFGGTRNCDWWFSDRAVLIDTAGRYTTHESDPVADRRAWQDFLRLLRRSRPRRPLNGVLVAVSVPELLGFTVSERANHARILRSRLDEIQTALGLRIPVYVLLTKCDLLPGFVDWFGGLKRAARADAWGLTFDLRVGDAGAAATQFACAFDSLVDGLADALVARLQAERDMQRRARIFMLPSQLRALGESLDVLIRGTFSSAGAASGVAPVLLRGVYLSSGTQSGTPLDRMLAAFGRELGVERHILPPNSSSGRSFFLSRLLTDVVFAEAELRGESPLRQRARWLVLVSTIMLFQLGALALGATWLIGYWRTSADMQRRETAVDRAHALLAVAPTRIEADPRPLLPALDALRALTPAQSTFTPGFFDIGRSAERKLAAAAQHAYARMLLGPFQRRIAKAIDETLRSGTDMNVQYEALKAYAMLHEERHFDATGIRIFVLSYWDSALAPKLDAGDRQELKRHLSAFVAAGAVGSDITLDSTLLDSVRARLETRSGAERIAMRLDFLVDAGRDAVPRVTNFTLATLGPAAQSVFTGTGDTLPAVPALYTLNVYRDLVTVQAPLIAAQLQSESSWVLNVQAGAPPQVNADVAEFMGTYRAAYANAWQRFLDEVRLKPPANRKEASRAAQLLGAADGPLASLVGEVVRQTSAGGPISPTDPSAARFAALAEFVRRGADGTSPLLNSLRTLSELPALPNEAALARFEAAARSDPEPVRSVLLALATSDQSRSSTPAAQLSRQVAMQLGASCIRLVAGQFPFDRRSTRDASIQEFASLFGPDGGFDQVFRQLLAANVDTSTNTWRARSAAGPTAPELERFRAAAKIREVLFDPGSRRPALELTFRPVDMDPDIDRFELDIDGQPIRYAHGPIVSSIVKWPGAEGQVRISVTPAMAGSSADYVGPWAVFRLMDHAAVQDQETPGHFVVVFDLGGRHASFDVSSSTGANPFRLRELEQFECPLAGQ